MMGGAISVTSTPGKGSVFSLRFPDIIISARLPSSAKISADREMNFNQFRPATILVVDDNDANRQYVAGIFAGNHHRLIFCSTGEEAIVKAREMIPDIVLLDVRMPGMDGRQTLAEIRKIPGMELVPAIAVTASIQQDDYFSGYVRKPFSRRELFDELAEFLPRHFPSDPPAFMEAPGPAVRTNGAIPPELLAQLRQLLRDSWPGLCSTMAVNKTKTFARELEILAEQWHYDPLRAYAGKLLHDAETYSVADMEKHLGEFAALVEQFAQDKEKIV